MPPVSSQPGWNSTADIIPIANLPEAFAGMPDRADVGFSWQPPGDAGFLREAVALAQAQHPDVIVLTGDFIHKGFRHVDQVADVLGALRAPLGVYAVLGNHDFSVRNALGIRRYQQLHQAVADCACETQGIHVLQNETHNFRTRQGKQLYLAGVDDLWSRVCDLERAFQGLSDAVPRVLLAHNPSTVEHLNGHRCDLMLSGHTHGGQVNLPGVGRLALGPRGRRFAAGIYQVNDTTLYVNKGVGFGFRIRYGVRPEVAVLTLEKKSAPLAIALPTPLGYTAR